MSVMRIAVLAVLACVLSAAGPMSSRPIPAAEFQAVIDALGGKELSAACCKMCNKGKACGDSCISRDKTCRKGAGCACDS